MKNTYILMIIQALLTLLLFFSEGYVRYTTMALFAIIDLILFIDLLTRRWSFEELLTLAAILCSGIFMIFYIYMKSSITVVFGVALMLLFLVIAMLDLISKPVENKDIGRSEKLRMPQAPAQPYDTEYDLDYEPQPAYSQQTVQSSQSNQNIQSSQFQKIPEPVMHIRQEKKSSEIKGKLAAKAVAYELEKEATELKNAERMMNNLKIYDAEKELVRETKILEDAQKQMDAMKAAASYAKAESKLRKEAAELMKAQKQMDAMNTRAQKSQPTAQLRKEVAEIKKAQKHIDDIQKLQEIEKEAKAMKKAEKQIDDIKKIKEVEKEAKSLKKAEKQVKEIQFLNQQEKIVKQAKDIAKAQKEIDTMNKNTKKSIDTQISKPSIVKDVVKVKTIKSTDDSFYFATENGNKFHEPGCLSIKKVPKNKLTLYTSKKDAMKKGLQPCSVCIPK